MSAEVISLCAYAKINLHLRVLAKREDGFHDLESIFQRISVADYLSIMKSDDENCLVESPLMPLLNDNTLTHAWECFKQAAGLNAGIHVRLIKNIPAGSGLGGGSSDAAALLAGVNQLFKVRFSDDELQRLALEVGSDVPFFLGSAAAFVAGRGELVRALLPRTDCFGVLLWCGVNSSTSVAYQLLDTHRMQFQVAGGTDGYEAVAAQYQLPLLAWQFVNDFQAVLEEKYPVVADAVADLYGQGAAFAQMSGAGSAVFGLFETEETMARAVCFLKRKWKWCKPFILLAL